MLRWDWLGRWEAGLLHKMRCPVCGSHFSRLDLRTQSETILGVHGEKSVEVVIGLCPECNSVLGVGGLAEKRRSRVSAATTAALPS